MLLEKMTIKNKRIIQKNEIVNQINQHKPEILLTMGAGDIDTLIEPIKQVLLKFDRFAVG
jgi:UDP-N-acetylmuramate--alanine ligase